MGDSNEPLLGKTEIWDEHQAEEITHSRPRHRSSWLPLITAAFVGALATTVLHRLPFPHVDKSHDSPAMCPSTNPIPMKAPRTNVWKNLDVQEAAQVRKWLMDPERGLNLTLPSEARFNDSVLHVIGAAHPPKATALKYLADGTSFDRYAHAVVNHGDTGFIRDYLVGPLPISEQTQMRPRSENYHNPIPLVSQLPLNWTTLSTLFKDVVAPLEEVTLDLFNASTSDGSLEFAGVAPMSYDGSWRRSWGQLRRSIPGSWLQPLDMHVKFDMTGLDPSKYRLLAIVHNRKMYDSVDSFKEAWKRGELVRSLPDPEGGAWATRAIKGQTRDLDDRPGPRTVQFGGPRYRLDEDEQYVTWMGWSFYIGFERDMGVHLWDINFRGERIIYELSPQEAMAQYSGSDPHQGYSVWLDRTFGMGGTVREVILGYDCPADAILLNATVHELQSSVRKNAICVFERESGRPLSRHTGAQKDEMGAVKGYELVVRSVSSVGNYDYIFDYTFQLDGTIEIRVSASGYLQGGAWDPDQDAYGHRLHGPFMGSLHDHVMNFKVDFDIEGTANSFMAIDLKTENVVAPWFDDDWGPTTYQQKIVRRMLAEESLLDYPPNMQGAYAVLNTNSTNAWGNPRGYTIHPGPLCHLTNLNSKRTEKNVNWAKHHLAVSRRKDEEPTSSSMWNMNLPGAPPVNFYNFFDNESISQEDLVVWLNLGTHHIPRAEDIPNTLTNVATSYVLLAPWNYNDHDVSLESRNSVILNNDGNWVIDEATTNSAQCMPPSPPPLAYEGRIIFDDDGQPVRTSPMMEAQMMGIPIVSHLDGEI